MSTNATVPNTNTHTASPWELTTRRVVLGAIFGALTLVLGGVGFGFVPVPNASGAGTILHIPTILGAIIGGPLVGMLCGIIFGVLALIAFPAFGPFVHLPGRILIGVFAWLVYTGLRRVKVPVVFAAIAAAVVGSLTNTVFVVGTALLLNMVTPAVALTLVPQAVIELIAAAVITPIIVVAVNSIPNARGD